MFRIRDKLGQAISRSEPTMRLSVLFSGSVKRRAKCRPLTNETHRTGYDYSETSGGSAPAWILGAIVGLAIVGMVWYGVSGPARVGPAPDQPAIQHTAQPPAPTAPPVEPTTTPKP